MASSTKEKKVARKYYKTHKNYREEKIANTQKAQKSNREEYNKSKREYYASNESYRKYKRNYAAAYRKAEPIKSKAKKLRGKIK